MESASLNLKVLYVWFFSKFVWFGLEGSHFEFNIIPQGPLVGTLLSICGAR